MLKKIHIILVILTLSCNSPGSRKLFYEGFNGNRLIVFVSEFIPEEKNTDAQLSIILMDKLNQRAFMILACYVSININRLKVSPSNDQMLNNTITAALSQGTVVQYSFNEKGYCEALAEYDISDFFKVIDKINNQ